MKYVLHLENDIFQIKGAKKVVSSTQNQAVVEVEDRTLIISGNEIEVKRLNLEDEEVCLAGKFNNIKLNSSEKKQPLLKRIFK